MKKYESTRERLSNFFFINIYPKMDKFGVDYRKTIYILMEELKITKYIVEEFILGLIEAGKLKEIRVLELSDEELKKREEENKEIHKEIKEVFEEVKIINKNDK
jgi:hypothetical protein